MTKYKMDEFNLPSSYVLPGVEKTTKRAWQDKRTFYPEFYKFALIFKRLGFFPVNLTKLSSDLSFSWMSVTTLFSVLTLPAIQIVAVEMCPLEVLKQYFAHSSLLIPLYTNVLYVSKLSTFIRLVQLMDSIDTNCCLKEGNREDTRKNTNFVIVYLLLSIFGAIFPVSFLLHGFTPEKFNSYICGKHRIVVTIMGLGFVYIICYQLLVLYERYHASLKSLEERPCDEVSERMVEDYRLVHAQLVRCVRLLNSSFSLWMLTIYTTSSIEFIRICYLVMYSDDTVFFSSVILVIPCILFFIYYPAVLTDRIYNKSKDTIHFTFRMALKPYSEDVLFQIYYFMRQVKINKAALSAGGLADVNKEFITKSLSLFSTFFIATIQLEPQMELIIKSLREWLTVTDEKQSLMQTTLQTFSTTEKE